MSRSAKGGGGSGKGSSMFAGIVVGMMLGLITAGVVAWYVLKKNPASFENKEHHEPAKPEAVVPPLVKAVPAPTPAPASMPVEAPAVAEPKQHLEFYKVLTEKPDGAAAKNADKSAAVQKAKSAGNAGDIYYVQAGSFPSQEDAEKLKVKLTLLGMEPSLRTVDIPNKGTYHRVRLGPFKGSEEMKKTLELLKQNGVPNATSNKAQ